MCVYVGTGGDEFTVDSIKTYELSQVQDTSKHATCSRLDREPI